MRSRTAFAALLLPACLLVAEHDVPLFCDLENPCESPEPSFCDLYGVYEASDMVGQTCIEPPPGVCKIDGDCEGSQPICGELERPNAEGEQFTVNECRACTAGTTGDTECMTKDAAAPICESGSCVECRTSADCTADANEPRCDTETGQCVGCVENSDCASEVCETSSGQCANAADVVYVATDGTDGAACGTQASRCLTIGGAQGGLDKVTASRKTIKLSMGTYSESVAIDAGETVDILGPATVAANGTPNSPVFDIDSGATVSLSEITASLATGDADADGIRCGGASTLTVSQSIVSGNDATGIEASNCTLTISQSIISQNDAGGLDINASSFDIQNNFIVSNGTGGAGGSLFGGMRIANSAAGDSLIFNTVANNQKDPGTIPNASGIICSAALQASASSNIASTNAGGAGQQITATCTLTHSNVEGGAPGTGNIDADPMFVNPAEQNFHLQPGSPCIDMADPAANLTIDIDGDRRPQGARHDIGADEVTQ